MTCRVSAATSTLNMSQRHFAGAIRNRATLRLWGSSTSDFASKGHFRSCKKAARISRMCLTRLTWRPTTAVTPDQHSVPISGYPGRTRFGFGWHDRVLMRVGSRRLEYLDDSRIPVQAMETASDRSASRMMRKKSWIKISVGLAGMAAISLGIGAWLFSYAQRLSERLRDEDVQTYLMLFLTIPYICFFMGLIELVTGRSWRETDATLQNMSQWRQIVLFVMCVFGSIGLVYLLAKLIV